MAWEDRRSYRDPIRPTGRYWAVLNGTVPLLPVRGVRVRLHSTFVLLCAIILLAGPVRNSSWQIRLECIAALFVAAICHELAHLRGRRWYGEAGRDRVVLTPIGGMPAVSSRWRLPSILGLLAGPAANLLICGACLAALVALRHPPPNPTHFVSYPFTRWRDPVFHLGWLYSVSLLLLVINLLPFFPLDFGQVVHVVLARRRGFEVSVRVMSGFSIIGSIVLAILGIGMQNWLVVAAAVTCLLFSVGLFLRWMREVSGAVELSEGLDDSYMSGLLVAEPRPKRHRRRLSRWAVRRLRRMAHQEELDQLHVDRILAKVSKLGLKSLTWNERRELRRATSRQRLGEGDETI